MRTIVGGQKDIGKSPHCPQLNCRPDGAGGGGGAAAMDGFHDPISSIRGQSVRLSVSGGLFSASAKPDLSVSQDRNGREIVCSIARALAKGEIEIKDAE